MAKIAFSYGIVAVLVCIHISMASFIETYKSCSAHITHSIVQIAQATKTDNPFISIALADALTVLLCEYFHANKDDKNWIAQDMLTPTGQVESLAVDGFFCSISRSNIREVLGYYTEQPDITTSLNNAYERQGHNFAHAIGVSFAYSLLCDKYNKDDWKVFANNNFIILDCALLAVAPVLDAVYFAGSLGLSNVIVLAYSEKEIDEQSLAVYAACEWQIINNVDGHNFESVSQAFNAAVANNMQPSLMILRVRLAIGNTNRKQLNSVLLNLLSDSASKAVAPNLQKLNFAKQYDIWQENFVLYEEANPHLAVQLQQQLRSEVETEFSSKAIALAEDLQETKDKWSIVNGCFVAIQLLVEPIVSSLILLYDEQIKIAYQALSKQMMTDKIIDMKQFDNSRDICDGIASLSFFTPFAISNMNDFLDILPTILSARQRCAAHCLLNNEKTFESLGSDVSFYYSLSHISLWRPCDVVEAVIAVQQAVIQENVVVIADNFTPEHYIRTIDDMERIVLGGYCLFDSRNSENKYQVIAEIIFIAQGREVADVIALAKKQTRHSQVWSMPEIGKFFANEEADISRLNQASRIVVANSVYFDKCALHIEKSKLKLLDDWLNEDKDGHE